jgi:LuxR family glucitol operon transcriptional activator
MGTQLEKLDSMRMSRGRLHVALEAFESDMRRLIADHLLGHSTEQEALGASYDSAKARLERDPAGFEASILDYLDFQPAYEVLTRGRQELPHQLAEEILAGVTAAGTLTGIRNRVAHGRPLLPDDPEEALRLLSFFQSRHWSETQNVVRRLGDEPAWEPVVLRQQAPDEAVIHNLPEPDYDETGFVGRGAESRKIIDALERGREAVSTITGEGGIGKTALALDVAYRLLDSPTNPYEAILWVSLKTERLTAYGVEELKSAIRGMSGTVDELGRGLVDDFRGGLKDLAEHLAGIRTLIIIDNLESAQGAEILEMYETLPDTVNYLFTSRIGIGQLEKRYPLPALTEGESKKLFRKFASKRGQKDMAATSEETLSRVVSSLRYSPLAIRWYVLSGEAGRVPLDILRSQDELLDFCVRNVYDVLSEDSKSVLAILRALDRSIGFEEFAVFSDMDIDALRSATQELTRGSLVVIEADKSGEVSGRLALTPTARAFLPGPDRGDAKLLAVLQRERQFKASLENSIAQQDKRMDLRRVLARDSADGPVVHLLATAINFASRGNYLKAREQVERARNFSPEYSEVYRVSGDLRVAEGQFEAAVPDYHASLKYASEPKAKAVSSYGLAVVLGRELHDVALALPAATQAYDCWPNQDTAFLLGTFRVWAGEYAEGQEYIEEALETATGKQRQRIVTAHVDSWKRWAEEDLKDGALSSAFNRALAGFHSGKTLGVKSHDLKFTETVAECCGIAFRSAARMGGSVWEDARLRPLAAFFAENAEKIVGTKKGSLLRDAMRTGVKTSTLPSELQADINKGLSALDGNHLRRLSTKY